MEEKTIDVIIPTYKPGKEFQELLKRLMKQKKAEWDKNYIQQVNLFNATDTQAKTEELIRYLSKYFRVSKEAMSIRLKELKMI